MDMEGNNITEDLASNYVLTKIDENLVDKKWRLFELFGTTVSLKNSSAIEAFITFNVTGNRVSGNSGCNMFAGSYQSGPGNQLKFSQMVSTRKMCMDMSIEDQMNKLFQVVDSYSLQNNVLSLNKDGSALAVFKAE